MDRDVGLFGGAAGRVLLGAVSLHSMVTGLVLGVVLFVGNGILFYTQAYVLVAPFTQIVLALALARFVLNGQYGEWEGTLFSGVGGAWSTVGLVAARYLLLTFLWVVPMMLFGMSIDQTAMASGMPDPGASLLVSLYIVASALTPPLFLIASVTANDFAELFSPAHWRQVFGGRLVDLVSVYAVYVGGVTMAVLLALPVITLGFLPNWKFGVLCLGIAACFLLGLCINLLGRLCGFFALGDFTHPADSEVLPAILPQPGVAPTSQSTQPASALPITAPVVPERAPITVSAAPPSASSPQVTQPTPAALPALLDAAQRIDPILHRFQQDPQGALKALEDLRQAFAPHPQVLVALCLCRHRNGEVEEAVRLATNVVPICFERGHVQLAAQVFKQLRREVDHLQLNREQILIVGEALYKKGDLAGAGAAYSIAIGRDPGETRAVKGLLQIAGVYAKERSKPEAALKVYDYLLKHCADSPHAEYMREGREHCLKQLPQPVG